MIACARGRRSSLADRCDTREDDEDNEAVEEGDDDSDDNTERAVIKDPDEQPADRCASRLFQDRGSHRGQRRKRAQLLR
jgi:hypothetical protein